MKKALLFILCLTVCLTALILTSCGGCKHEFDEGIVVEHATCEQSGRRLLTCKLCGGSKYETIEPAHYYVNSDVITPSTCVTDGERKTVCVVCGAESTAKIPCPGEHTWDNGVLKGDVAGCAGTAKAVFTCKKCRATEERDVTLSGGIHVFLVDHYTKAPTCFEPGEAVYRCASCGATKTDVVAPTEEHIASSVMESDETGHWLTCRTPGCPAKDEYVSHNYIDDSAVTPVPTDGCKAGTKGVYCTVCDYHTRVYVYSTDPHTYSAGVLSEDRTTMTYSCTKCGDKSVYSTAYAYTFEENSDFKFIDQTASPLTSTTAIRYEVNAEKGNHYCSVTQTAASASMTQFQTSGGSMLRTSEQYGFFEIRVRASGNIATSGLSVTLFNSHCSDWGDGLNGPRGFRLLEIKGTGITMYGKSTGLFGNQMTLSNVIGEEEFTTIRAEYESSKGYIHCVYYVNGTPVMETNTTNLKLGEGTGVFTSVYLSGNIRAQNASYDFDNLFIGYLESGIPDEG